MRATDLPVRMYPSTASMHASMLTPAKDYMVWHIALPCNFVNASYVGVIQHAQVLVIERRHLHNDSVNTHLSRLKMFVSRHTLLCVDNPNYLAGS